MAPDDPSLSDATNAFGAGTRVSRPTASADAVPSGRDEPRGPRGERWIPLLVIVLALTGTGLGLWRAERRALADPVQQGERGKVVGVDGRSLLAADHLRRAFALVQARVTADEVVTDVALSPVRVRVAVRDGLGHARSFSVDLASTVRTQDDGRSTGDGPALAQIDTAGPERFVRTALARSGHLPVAVQTLGWSFSATDEVRQHWTLQLQDVPIPDQGWVAHGDGRSVRRVGDTVPSGTPIPVPPTATTPSSSGKRKRKPGRRSPSTSFSLDGFRTNAVQIVVGDTRIITDPASARRLKRCLRRSSGTRAAAQRCLDAMR